MSSMGAKSGACASPPAVAARLPIGRQRRELRPAARVVSASTPTPPPLLHADEPPQAAGCGAVAARESPAAQPSPSDEPLSSRSDLSEVDEVDRQLAALDGGAHGGSDDRGSDGADEMAEELTEALTAERLRELTGVEDLDLVTGTELRVDAGRSSVGAIGDLMPRLISLRFSAGSRLTTMRDLGTKLVRLQVLWARSCGVRTLSGLQFSHQLRELFVAFNDISDISVLGALLNLEVADLEGNCVRDTEQLAYLNGLEQLRDLSLSGNPVAATFGTTSSYRAGVRALLDRCPALATLDDVALEQNGSAPPGATGARFVDPLKPDLAGELELVAASIRANGDAGMEQLVQEQHRTLYSRQSTSCAGARRRPPSTTGKKVSPADTERVVSSAPTAHAVAESPTRARRVQSSDTTPSKGHAHQARATGPPTADSPSGGAASALTQGSGVFSGNLTRNLRARRAVAVVRATSGGVVVTKAAAPPTSSLVPEESDQRARAPAASDDEHADDEGVAPDVSAGSTVKVRACGVDNTDEDGDDDDDLERELAEARRRLRECPLEALEFTHKYRALIEEIGAAESARLTTSDILAVVGDTKRGEAKLLQEQLLADAAGRGAHYEALCMHDLGGDVDDVL